MVDIINIQRVSVSTNTNGSVKEGTADSTGAGFSPDGTKVFFYGAAGNLLTSGTSRSSDVFVKDLATGSITNVSVASDGITPGNNSDVFSVLSDDGNLVVFRSASNNLSTLDNVAASVDVYVKNITTKEVTLVSVANNIVGDASSGGTVSPAADISSDNSKIVFETLAHNLAGGDTGNIRDIVVKNIVTGDLTMVSKPIGATNSNGNSFAPNFSPDGTKVVFYSSATNLLTTTDNNATSDIFLKDLTTGAVSRLSVDSAGNQSNGASTTPIFSEDGSKVIFLSSASNLVSGDTNGVADAFIKNLSTGAVTLVSQKADGTLANGAVTEAVFSPDGTKVAFISTATNLVSGDTNGVADVFVKDLTDNSIIRVNTNIAGVEATLGASKVYFSHDSNKLMFTSGSTNLVGDKTTTLNDVFVVTLSPDKFIVAGNDTLNVSEGGSLTNVATTLRANDVDPEGQAFSVTGVDTTGTVGTVTYVAATHEVSYAADTTALNALAQGQVFTDSFTYSVTDLAGNVSTATATVNVTGVNDAPVAHADSLITNEDVSLIISKASLLGNDVDVDHGAVLNIVDITANVEHGTLVDNGDGTYTYTAAENYHGTDSFTYSMKDEYNETSSATVSITVDSVNDAPVATDDNATLDEDASVVISVASLLANDTDVDAGAVLSFTGVDAYPANGSLVDNGDGTYTYSPNRNFNGTDSFSYSVTDELGAVTTGVVHLGVNAVNDAPVGVADSLEVNEDATLTIQASTLLANDYDVDAHATLSVANIAINPEHGTLVDNGDGSYTFTPSADFNGADGFTYTVTDEFGATSTAVAAIVVNAVNDAPVGVADSITVDEDASIIITKASLLANDTDIDAGAVLSIANIVVDPEHGTLTDNGDDTYTYRPTANYNGSDSFSYTVSDELGATSTGVASITVNAVNDAPVAVDDNFTTDEDVSLVISVASLLANDADVDNGDVPSFTGIVSTTSNGSLVDNGNGTLTYTYTPTADFNGVDGFTYSVVDAFGGTSTATASISVVAVNDAPVGVADTLSVDEDAALVITGASLLANDTDADRGTTLSITGISVNPAAGTLADNGDGTYTYRPNANYFGTDNFTYTLTDNEGGTSSASVAITVNSVNDNPSARNDVLTIKEDQVKTISFASVLANDTDIDAGDVLRVDGIVTAPTHGALVDNGAGAWVYTPVKDFYGQDSFVYRVRDGHGGFSEATMTITLTSQAETITGTPNDDVLNGSSDVDFIYGLQGNDLINSYENNDSIDASTGNDTVYAGTGNDTVVGNTGEDSLYGEDGNDSLRGNSENDMLSGGDGLDTLDGGSEDDTLSGGAGNDRLIGGYGQDSLLGDDGSDRLDGGDGKDTLAGGTGDDSIYGDNDDDVASGGDGIDRVEGNAGNDTLNGDAGADSVYGGDGNDVIDGGADNDRLYGDAGNDTIHGSDGADRIEGLADADMLYGDAGIDSIYGGDGNDVIEGGADKDRLYGDAGDDSLLGGVGADNIEGGFGADTLDGGAERDSLYGGDGADVFRFASRTDSTTTARDQIYDYVDGVDKIDLHGLGYTGISTAVTPLAGELKLTYTASGDSTYLRDLSSGFNIGISGNHLAELDNSDFIF